MGLASQPVADLKRKRALDDVALGRLIDEQGVAAVAIYEEVFASILPATWIKVGEWTIPDNVGVSDDSVAFLAPDRESAGILRAALDRFAGSLPPGVIWTPDVPRLPPTVSQ